MDELDNLIEQEHFFDLLKNNELWRELNVHMKDMSFVFNFTNGQLMPKYQRALV